MIKFIVQTFWRHSGNGYRYFKCRITSIKTGKSFTFHTDGEQNGIRIALKICERVYPKLDPYYPTVWNNEEQVSAIMWKNIKTDAIESHDQKFIIEACKALGLRKGKA